MGPFSLGGVVDEGIRKTRKIKFSATASEVRICHLGFSSIGVLTPEQNGVGVE